MIKLTYLAACLCLLSVACQRENSQKPSPGDVRTHFSDVAEEVGLEFQHDAFRWAVSPDPVAMMGGGLCWIDFNRDGWLDLFVVNSYSLDEAGRWQTEEGGLPLSVLYRNDQGRFTDVSKEAGAGLALRGNGCVAADFDRDGWSDLYVTTSRSNVLLWNNGDGTFSEGAQEAGADGYGWHSSAVVGDLNGDSWPDIFVAGYVDRNASIEGATLGFPNTNIGTRDLLYINKGREDGRRSTFREVGEIVGLDVIDSQLPHRYEYGLGAALSDFDADGDVDLLVANDTNPNRLYVNTQTLGGIQADPSGLGFRFREAEVPAIVEDNNSGMGVALGDFDDDGSADLLVTNMGRQFHSVYRNSSQFNEMVFNDVTASLGIPNFGVGWTGWGTTWADIDLDSDLDLVVVNGAIPVTDLEVDGQQVQMFFGQSAQGKPGQFVDAGKETGMEAVGPLIGRGGALADYDNDGDLDLAINSIAGKLTLLRNESSGNNWLQIAIENEIPGTVALLTLPDGRHLRREVQAGSSFQSSEDPRLHFGLGSYTFIPEIVIRWPDGEQLSLKNIAANQQISLDRTG